MKTFSGAHVGDGANKLHAKHINGQQVFKQTCAMADAVEDVAVVVELAAEESVGNGGGDGHERGHGYDSRREAAWEQVAGRTEQNGSLGQNEQEDDRQFDSRESGRRLQS